MGDTTPAWPEQDVVEACQDCGSTSIRHVSLLSRRGEQRGTFTLLCDDCHRARLAVERADDFVDLVAVDAWVCLLALGAEALH